MPKMKSVLATANFSATKNSAGKILTDTSQNVVIGDKLQTKNSFCHYDDVFQQLPTIFRQEMALTSEGITRNGEVVLPEFAGAKQVVFAVIVQTDTLIVSAPNVGTYALSDEYIKLDEEYFDSLAVCKNNFYALKGKKIRIAPIDNVVEFQNYHYLDLPTDVVAIFADDCLYAVGNNVYKVIPDGEGEHFKVYQIASNLGNFEAKSLCFWEKSFVFAQNDKIMQCQNGHVNLLFSGDIFVQVASIFQGVYYASGKLNGSNCIFALDLHSKKIVATYPITCQNMTVLHTLFVCNNGVCYSLENSAQSCFWRSAIINFDNTSNTKYLRNLSIKTQHNLTVTVCADARRIYHVQGKKTLQTLPICGHGREIFVELRSSKNMEVDFLQLVAQTKEGSLW